MSFPVTLNQTEIPPILIMLQGLPGSGKSTVAKRLAENFETLIHIHSSDSLRAELYGDENTQGDNNALFAELHRRIREDLKNGISVIYDATNINKKKRMAFLKELKNINCYKYNLSIMTPYDVCLKNNKLRERFVPEDVIERMYKHWQPAYYDEGFDRIYTPVFGMDESENEWSIDSFVEDAKTFDQENSHHNLTLGEHCLKAFEYVRENYPDNKNLSCAALIHDCGKIFTKSRLNAKGEDDGNCHYYQHHCCGAYDSVFYLIDEESFSEDDVIYISNLIYHHMHPFMQWKQSEKLNETHRILLGEKMYSDIMKLHEADLSAH